jgi:hypothetical protein
MQPASAGFPPSRAFQRLAGAIHTREATMSLLLQLNPHLVLTTIFFVVALLLAGQ